MVIAMIFGAHLMPYSWLYQSKSYFALSIAIPVIALDVGLYILAAVMILTEILFSVLLSCELKKLQK